MDKKYNIGLDIGTTSVGWVLTECNTQKIIRKNGKSLWGVRLFDEGTTAETTRLFRGTRRRYDRRRNRIKWLQEEFNDDIKKIDSNFFKKLQESKYHINDGNNKTIKLSKEESQQTKKYNDKYKTIYHLRKRLIDNSEQEDIRLVYMAIHHIIKYRGNFLFGNDSFSVNNLNVDDKLISVFNTIASTNSNLEISENHFELININEISSILLLPSKIDIKEQLKEKLSSVINKNFATEFGKAMVGGKFSINKLLMIDELDKEFKISFSNEDFDDQYDELENVLSDKIESLEVLKELYNMIFLKKLFKGKENTSISHLMVDKYNQHQKDLQLLKRLFTNNRKLYDKIFRNKTCICLYEEYIHNKISSEDFISKLNKLLVDLFDSNTKLDEKLLKEYNLNIKYRIINGDFLPRITDSENGKYPYQLNKDELVKIIENQGKHYPFLLEKTKDDTYKIIKILEFKIPYYIGPLVSDNQSRFAWLEKKQDHIKINPYNFEEIVDKEKTAEKFIKRMISHCTYLLNEYALPNNSILYSKFKVMNELKQVKINGCRLTNRQQQKIIEDLFLKTTGIISNKKFINYLRTCSDFCMYNNFNITGYSADNKFANSMQPYVDFFGRNGLFKSTPYTEEDAEKIIEWITIFEDKDILEKKVRYSYPELNDGKIKSILKKKYKGWGSLSSKLLNTKYYNDKKDEILKSIMDLMFDTDENFMQILNNKTYKFQNMIKEFNEIDDNTKVNYELVANLATSPSVKKGIYQALKIVEELVEYMGSEPVNIVIEMARSDDKKERKADRKKYLAELYGKSKSEIENYNKLLKQLNNTEINSQKLFLYFIQEGKCLYSRKPLNIEDLDSYEIDHIIPRTLIKDDSIDNKALVYRDCNQIKAANYVLPKQYRSYDNIKWWEHLKKIGLISAKKFHSLIRNEYKDDDIQGFINRQLVETRQITKHVANILSNFYKKANVVYLKATLSHDYRKRYELFKFRELNDYHHAHDAYLASVLGEYKEKYMTKEIDFKMVKELNNRLRDTNNYSNLKYGYVINSLDEVASDIVNDITKNLVDKETGEVLFDAKNFNNTVEKMMYRNDILVTKKTEIKTGQFYKQTILPKGQGNSVQKSNMPINLYGGYTSIQTAYTCIVKYGKNLKMIGIPIQVALNSKKDNNIKLQFIKEHLNIKDDESFLICKDYIPYETEMIYKSQNVYIKGYGVVNKNFELSNAYQLKLKSELMQKWKYALQYIINNDNQFIKYFEEYSNDIIDYLLSLTKIYPLFEDKITKIKQNLNYTILENSSKKKIILEILKVYHCNSVTANLSSFGLDKTIGRLSGKTIDGGIIVSKSITGIKESRYEFSNYSYN